MKKTKLFHKILAFTLILSILFSMFVFGPVVTATADESNTNTEEIEYWSGKPATYFAGGTGTKEDPYLIDNGGQLYLMVMAYSNVGIKAINSDKEVTYFKLTNDIYLNNVTDADLKNPTVDSWNAKGFHEWLNLNYADNLGFCADFDGNGYTIYGLYANGNGEYAGLFPVLTDGANVRNVNLKNSFVTAWGEAGGIAGHIGEYWKLDAVNINNCSVDNAVITSADVKVGGLVGGFGEIKFNVSNCSVTNSDVYSTSTENTELASGLVGTGWGDTARTITNCFTDGSVHPVTATADSEKFNTLASKFTYTNVYTSAKENFPATGVTYLTEAQMQGDAAKTNMQGFDFLYQWKVVADNYPVPNQLGVWDGSEASGFAGGSGTKADPYLIENGAQFYHMVKVYGNVSVNTATSSSMPYFKITRDIILNYVYDADMVSPTAANWKAKNFKSWFSTAETKAGFYGELDGDGHTVYGFFTDGSSGSMYNAGLIPSVIGKANIKNLNLKNSFVYGKNAGCIVGKAYGSSAELAVDGCSSDNCYIQCWGSGYRLGGIVGGGEATPKTITITNCSATNLTFNNPCEYNSSASGKMPGVQSGMLGFVGSGSHVVRNCYTDATTHPVASGDTDDLNTNGVQVFNRVGDYVTYINVYTAADCPIAKDGVTKLTAEQMKDDNAKTYMPGLSYRFVWETVENGYPVINLRDGLWDGTSVSSHDDFDGEGTKESPYLIENGAQLYFAAINNSNLTDGSYYKLVRDIVLNDTSVQNWEASAKLWGMNKAKRFNGTLDGDGHTIEGLYINVKSTVGRYGLFSYIGQDSKVSDKVAEIKNITFKAASVTNTTTSSFEGVGIVAGQASGETIFENIYIDENCKVNAPNVKGVAAIVARGYSWDDNDVTKYAGVTINNCAVHGTYTGSSHVGSFLGTFWGGTQTISNSYSAANVPVTTSRTPVITNTYATEKLTEGTLYDKDVVLVDANKIKGEDAKTNMPGLDFDFMWKTVEGGYPVLRDMDDRLPAWNGSAAESLKGEGTKANPYKISNGAELYYMVSTYSNADVTVAPETQTYFEITADINLGNKQWYTPAVSSWITNEAYNTIGFNGIIYGNGHKIYNFYSNAVAGAAGLIPVATQGTKIYDLHLVNGNLPRKDYRSYALGGLIGLAKAQKGSTPITVSGCSVENFTIAGVNGAAGLVGYTYSQSLVIKDCYVVDSSFVIDAGTSASLVGTMNGSAFNNSFVIQNCYTDTLAAPVMDNSFKAATTFKNVYTTDETYNNTVTGLFKVNDAQITGATAKSNLNGFNFNQVWAVVDGSTPVHTGMDYRANYFTGNPALSFASGTGSEEDPFIIKTADQLYLLATLDRETTHGKYYKLANDITISNVYDNWQNDDPFTWAVKKAYLDGFTYTSSFAGTLDGAGYKVSGLYYYNAIVDGGNYAYGLIPFVTADAVIKNITVSDTHAVVSGNGAYVGAVAGAAHVMKEDIEANKLHAVQFVGVNVINATIGVDTNNNNKGEILGGASYGVKFDLCNTHTANIHGTINKYFVENNCNNLSPYRKDVVVVNNITADDTYATVRNVLLGKDKTTYISSIDMTAGNINVCDLFAAKSGMNAEKPEEYLVWSDEFNGSSLNTSVWTQSNTSMSTGTTLEYANTANFNGNNVEIKCIDTGSTDANGNKIYNINYGLHTADTMSYKYGRLEMRAKIPVGAGAFPALWLSSRDAIGYDKYSEFSTEIDVFEVFGKKEDVNTAVACIHKWYNDENGDKVLGSNNKPLECSCGTATDAGNGFKVEESDRSTKISYEWYNIVFEWTEYTMSFWIYKDGEERPEKAFYTVSKSDMDNAKSFDYTSFKYVTGFDLEGYNTDNAGIFNQFMYPIITNHMYTIGSAYHPYQGNASDIDPTKLTFEIDYIRLYQKNDDKSQINLK